ncbi:hypothetical protein Tco_0448433 [Tanacetum coccineum]
MRCLTFKAVYGKILPLVIKHRYVEFEEMGEVDIETLTMEKYLALNRGDTRRGVRKPKIEGNVDFEIKG